MAKSSEDMIETMISNLPEKTGKSLDEWLAIMKGLKCTKHGEYMKALKGEHGVSHGFANLITQIHMKGRDIGRGNDGEDLVASQYSKGKEGLKPIYEALTEYLSTLGEDVEFAPKKSYVSVRRNKQFALIQPSTKTRVDLGLQLKGKPPLQKLEAAGSWNGMVSHRVRLSDVADITDEVKGWLQEAYNNG